MNDKEKLLHNIAAQYITGNDIKVELEGSKLELECLQRLLEVSKKLKIELDRQKPNKKRVLNLLENKKSLSIKFQDLSGIIWRL